jgi:hypothetical protein
VSGIRRSYVIAKTLQLSGCRVVVRCELSEEELSDRQHPYFEERQYVRWLYDDPDIETISSSHELVDLDGLLFEACRDRPRYPGELDFWTSRTRNVAAWNSELQLADLAGNLRADAATFWRYARFLPRARTVVMARGATVLRPTAWCRPTGRQVFTPHPQYLYESGLRRRMYDEPWRVDNLRPYHAVFSGATGTSPIRQTMVRQIECLLKQGRVSVLATAHWRESAPSRGRTDRCLIWLPVAGEGSHPIPAHDWAGVLGGCDFCICPPGLVPRTHRVIESLLRGSIPILDCPDEYDIGLVDGVNCLVVRGNDWGRALERSLSFEPASIIEMRRAVTRLVERHLTFASAGQRWLRFMGLEPAPRGAI